MKKFIQILSLVVVVAITCITLVGCKNEKATTRNNDEMIVDVVEENGIGFKMTRLSTGSSSGVSITATVLPSNATDKTLTWNLEWVERTGYSASDYTLSNFVSKVVSSNTLNCNITLLKRFPMQIKVIVASKTNSDVSASCLLDCYSVMDFNAKEGGAQFELSYSVDSVGNKYEDFGCSDLESEIVLEGMTYDSIFNTKTAKLNSIIEEEIIDCYGTIKTTESYVVLIGLTETLKSELEEAGYTVKNVDYVDFEETTIIGLLANFISWDPNNIAPYKALINKLNFTDNWFELYITFTNKYNEKIVNYVEKTIQLKGFSVADYFSDISVENISLDKTTYTF